MKPLLRVLAGETVTPQPVWLMRQAGRYLPEYRALRESAGGFLDLCLTPEKAIEVTLQPVHRFGMDAAILFSDILVVPYALGQALDYREGEGPVLEPVRDEAAFSRLSLNRLPERLAPIYSTVTGVRSALPKDCTLIGFAGSPWTVAAYMIEGQGGGKSDFVAARRMMIGNPALFGRIIDLVVEATILYLEGQIEAGAEALQLFDSWAGLLDEIAFYAWVIVPTARIVRTMKARHPTVPIIGFPRLAGLNYPLYASEVPVDALGLDTTVPLEFAAGLAKPTQGNLDPILLLEGGEPLEKAVRKLAAMLQDKPHIFNLGHGVLPSTNPDNIARLVDTLRTFD